MELAVLEFNAGPGRDRPLSAFPSALIQAEMLRQFARAGIVTACQCPAASTPPGNMSPTRSLIDGATLQPRPSYDVYRLLGDVPGRNAVRLDVDPYLPALAVDATEGGAKALAVFLLNKTEVSVSVSLGVEGALSLRAEAKALVARNLADDHAEVTPLPARVEAQTARIALPPFSFVRIDLRTASGPNQ
ncbi:MAG: hypothetical protein NTW86_28555 [Candidatus Sumerlaeota bacterium]|nr:hypothetical protein [Candidatus Sumerlaeota bacterium]